MTEYQSILILKIQMGKSLYILDNNKIFANSDKTYAKQDIGSDEKHLTFVVYVWDDEKDVKASFDVNCEQINILTLAEELVNMQKRLEEIIK